MSILASIPRTDPSPGFNGRSRDKLRELEANLSRVIRAKPPTIRLVLTCLLAGGHTLLEDVPGTGKTTLAKSLARSVDGVFRRLQFTPDLLPADITGSSFYQPRDGTFEFRPGPVFSNVLLADEINRTSPRTQSALLEVMSETQVTVEGVARDLQRPFFVIATQNPAEFQGTFPLPEAQLDRFAMRIAMGYPDAAEEVEILFSHNDHDPFADLQPVLNGEEVVAIQNEVKQVRVDPAVARYIVELTHATRHDTRLRLGVSPRGSLTLYRCSQAWATLDGRNHVLPEDVRVLAVPVLAHRLLLDNRSRFGGVGAAQIIEELLKTIPVPR